MYSKKYFLKTLAIFMALNIFTQVVAPTVSMALTSGPTTPEVASFEPVDTTDMVDLATGDFNYNIPLLEVPGPEGGYPVALSYHAGIMPGQDASWVGLGWNLNPGCINRTVNNFADDYNNATYSITDDWNGGETLEYTFGVGVSLANIVSVGVDVATKTDTYRGNGGSFGLTVGFMKGIGPKNSNNEQTTGIGVSGTVGYDSWDGSYWSANAGVGNQDSGLGIGLTVGSAAGQGYVSVGASSDCAQTTMGISLSSGGLKTSATIGGVNSVTHNDNFGKISSYTEGLALSIPVGMFSISAGVKYTRYWMHGQSSSSLYGVLNSKAANNLSWTDNNGTVWQNCPYGTSSLDCNILYDPTVNVVDQSNLDWTTNPVVATYDNYTVLSQGVNGSIEPIMLDNGSFFRKIYSDPSSGNPEMKTDIFRPFSIDKHMFRFRNDFSNSHKVTANSFSVSGSIMSYSNTGLGYSCNEIDPRGVKQTLDGNNKPTYKRIAGSKHIEYYTNEEIANNTAKANGFINTPAIPNTERSTRKFTSGIDVADATNYSVAKNIGGYSITNESGVTYHYALPVYTYEFFQSSTSSSSVNKSITTRRVFNPNPYAYTWMLTAVTGPDYVDRNNNGFVDAADWGYWVNFDYGRWTDRYGFRTPDTGSNTDVDGSATYSKGGKEIYYLNAINTRTHTALFVKEERLDVKGMNSSDYNTYDKLINYVMSNVYKAYNPVKSLKLSEIILIENKQLNMTSADLVGIHHTVGNEASAATGDCNQLIDGTLQTYPAVVNWGNVLDMADLDLPPTDLPGEAGGTYVAPGNDIRNLAVKRIVFNQDYSLCQNTSNSFSGHPVPDYQTAPGRLTLNSIRFFGRNQVQLLPSTNFNYELSNPNSTTIAPTWVPGDPGWPDARLGRIYVNTSGIAGDPYQTGDIVTFYYNGYVYYLSLIKVVTPNNGYAMEFDVLYLGKNIMYPALKMSGPGGTQINVTATQTKNPAYTAEFYDVWGMLKSDYAPKSGVKRNKTRIGTDVSARAVDCWSLRSIETPTGAKINITYEGDDYKDVVLKNKQIYNFKPEISKKKASESTYSSFQRNHPRNWGTESMDFIFQVFEGDLQQPINEVYQIGDKIEIVSAGLYISPVGPWPSVQHVVSKAAVTITGITGNTISVRDDNNKILAAPTISPAPTDYSNYYYFHHGAYVLASDKKLNYGGGLRTKSIETTDGLVSSRTTYEYKNVASNSSGSTSFDPLCYNELERLNDYTSSNLSFELGAAFRNQYSREYYTAFAKIMAMAKDLVAPGVLYESVKVKNSVTKNGLTTSAPTYQAYQFQPFKEEMLDFTSTPEVAVGNAKTRTSKITNKTSQIGNLLSIKTYDRANGLLSEVRNTYTSAPESGQGIIEQVFHEERRMNPDEGSSWENKFSSVTVKSECPSVLVSTTKRDYAKRISTTSTITAFDFYTGAVTETQTTDRLGNTFISISDPAYNYYPGMGLKLNTVSNSNMLSQTAGSYSLKKINTTSSVSATVTSTGSSIAPNEILVTLSTKLPMNYHVGSKVMGLSAPVFITYIADNRLSFKTISHASTLSSDLGVKTLVLDNANLLSASITTWNDTWNYRMYNGSSFIRQQQDEVTGTVQDEKVWRMKSSYIWSSPYTYTDGSYVKTGAGAYDPFVYATDYAGSSQVSPYWLAVSTNTLFTPFSKPLEQKDVNGKYAATKFSNDESYILASAINARYTEFTHSGAEFAESAASGFAEGEVYGSTFRTSQKAHTGSYCFTMPVGGAIKYSTSYGAIANYQNSTSYKISVWVDKSMLANAQLYATITNGTATTTTQSYDATKHITCGNWVLMTMDFTTPVTSTAIEVGVKNAGTSGWIYVDDFRFQPYVSTVTSNVYDTNTGLLAYVLGTDNRYVRYEYDSRYRLKATYKETTNGEVKMNEYNYNFARPIN